MKFNINVSAEQKQKIEAFREPTSFIIESMAFRLPAIKELRDLLLQTGPLIAPSANPEGLAPASDTAQAEEYFGHEIDMYIDGGKIEGKPSKLIKLHKDGTVNILRE